MRWGLPLMVEQKPEDAVRSRWLAGAVEVMVSDRDPAGDPVTLELRIGDEPIVIAARDGGDRSHPRPGERPGCLLTGPEKPILGLLFGILDQGAAEAMGVALVGDPDVVERFAADAAPAA